MYNFISIYIVFSYIQRHNQHVLVPIEGQHNIIVPWYPPSCFHSECRVLRANFLETHSSIFISWLINIPTDACLPVYIYNLHFCSFCFTFLSQGGRGERGRGGFSKSRRERERETRFYDTHVTEWGKGIVLQISIALCFCLLQHTHTYRRFYNILFWIFIHLTLDVNIWNLFQILVWAASKYVIVQCSKFIFKNVNIFYLKS